MGTVYLIHFDKPIGNPNNPHGQAQHYIGYAGSSLRRRLKEHRRGTGSRIMQVVTDLGIGWRVARVWRHATRKDERRLKNYHKARQLCPICKGETR